MTPAEDASLHKRFITGARVIDPVVAYLRIFDSQSSKLSFVYPATQELRMSMESLPLTLAASGNIGATSLDLAAVLAAANTRVSGPESGTVQVVLLQDILFLAALCDPAVCSFE
jgi:hypothetical protein